MSISIPWNTFYLAYVSKSIFYSYFKYIINTYSYIYIAILLSYSSRTLPIWTVFVIHSWALLYTSLYFTFQLFPISVLISDEISNFQNEMSFELNSIVYLGLTLAVWHHISGFYFILFLVLTWILQALAVVNYAIKHIYMFEPTFFSVEQTVISRVALSYKNIF